MYSFVDPDNQTTIQIYNLSNNTVTTTSINNNNCFSISPSYYVNFVTVCEQLLRY